MIKKSTLYIYLLIVALLVGIFAYRRAGERTQTAETPAVTTEQSAPQGAAAN